MHSAGKVRERRGVPDRRTFFARPVMPEAGTFRVPRPVYAEGRMCRLP